MPTLTDRRELATVLAALRAWQSMKSTPAIFHVIATDGDQLNPLSDDEIDQLCERLNVRTYSSSQQQLPLHWGDINNVGGREHA